MLHRLQRRLLLLLRRCALFGRKQIFSRMRDKRERQADDGPDSVALHVVFTY